MKNLKVFFKTAEKWKIKKFLFTFAVYIIISIIFLITTSSYLYTNKTNENTDWETTLHEVSEETPDFVKNSIPVTVGTYVENLKELSIKNSYYRVILEVWFKWDGHEDLNMKDNFHIYKGSINKSEVLQDYHKDGKNYQLLRVDVTVSKNYKTPRFPLESHQLRTYIESEYTANKVSFIADKDNSGINQSLGISGYDVKRNDTSIFMMKYDTNHGDPRFNDSAVTYEHLTAIELNRDGIGLYIKCFIALFGTTLWVIITLAICTYHNIDPLSMIPAALFGTVSNIMVGANLLPDALDLGLLEFVNIWGIITILAAAVAIIEINRIRNKYKDNNFAMKLGKLMFLTITILTIIGHIVLPLSAYMFN